MKVLLDMYLKKNLGDDLFLKIISEKYPNVTFYARTRCKYKKSMFDNVVFLNSFFVYTLNFCANLLKIYNLSALNYYRKKTDAMVTLGGSMFIEDNNFNSKKVLIKYANCEKPYFVIGANFGPYYSESFINTYSNVFTNAYDTCFRDKKSYNLFSRIKTVRYASDIVFSLDTQKFILKNEKKVVISVINLDNRSNLTKYSQKYIEFIHQLIEFFLQRKYSVVLMSFCNFEGDNVTIKKILNMYDDCANVSEYDYTGDINEALNILASAEYVLATRFHAMILGLMFNKKVLPIIYSNKTLNVLHDLKIDNIYCNINDIDKFNIDSVLKIKSFNFSDYNLKDEALKHFSVLDRFLNKEE